MAVFADNPVLTHHWHAVARSADLGAGPLSKRLLGRDLVVYRGPDGAVVAAPDRCPHREAPLTLGCMKDGVLQCAYHGWEFGSGGALVSVPSALPGVPAPPTGNLKPYHAVERYGLVWVCLDDAGGRHPVHLARHRPEFRRINNPVQQWTTSATRLSDNFMDYTHFPFVHTGTFGNESGHGRAPVRGRATRRRMDGVPVRGRRSTIPRRRKRSRARPRRSLHRRMTHRLPRCRSRSAARSTTRPGSSTSCCCSPRRSTTSSRYFTFVVWRNDDFSVSGRRGASPSTGRSAPRTAHARAGAGRPARCRRRLLSACRPTRAASSGAASSQRCSTAAEFRAGSTKYEAAEHPQPFIQLLQVLHQPAARRRWRRGRFGC